MRSITLILAAVLLWFMGGPALAQDTDTPVPTITPTPTATFTPTPDLFVFSTIPAPGGAGDPGQPVAVRFEITAGELLIAVLLFALFVLNLLSLVVKK